MILKKGIPLGKNGVLEPDLKFDFGKGQFTKGGATIEWKLP